MEERYLDVGDDPAPVGTGKLEEGAGGEVADLIDDVPSNESLVDNDGRPPPPLAEEKLETEPLALRDLRLLGRGVVCDPAPPATSMGVGVVGVDGPSGFEMAAGDEMVVLESESARSFADNSFDLVLPIFFDGELPMLKGGGWSD